MPNQTISLERGRICGQCEYTLKISADKKVDCKVDLSSAGNCQGPFTEGDSCHYSSLFSSVQEGHCTEELAAGLARGVQPAYFRRNRPQPESRDVRHSAAPGLSEFAS